jgi:protocatechuate 3,4-dioxygenase beta subunit
MKRKAGFAGIVALIALGGLLYYRNGGDGGSEAEKSSKAVSGTSKAGSGAAGARGEKHSTGSVIGRVVDAAGAPVAGAVVHLHPEKRSTALMAHDGVSKVGQDGMVLEQGGSDLSGVVRDASGGPIAGAIVRVVPLAGVLSERSGKPAAALTDDEGRYQLSLAHGQYLGWAFHMDYVPSSSRIEISGDAHSTDFALAPGAVVEGTVRRLSDGGAVGAAMISYATERTSARGLDLWRGRVGRGWVKAEADGRFRISGIHSGTLVLSARGQGMATSEPVRVALDIGEERGEVDVFLEDAFEIRGVVRTRDDGEPVGGVTVAASSGAGGGAASGESDDQGHFVIEGLAPGSYNLMATHDDYLFNFFTARVKIENKDVTDAVVELDRGAAISGRVEPAQEADISIAIEPGAGVKAFMFSTNAHSKSSGEFRLTPVAPGSMTLEAKTSDGRKGRLKVEVPKEGLSDVVIKLEEMGSMSGRVVDASGDPLSDARITLKKDGASSHVIVNGRDMSALSGVSGPDGAFSVRGIEVGSYVVSVLDSQGQKLEWADASRTTKPLLMEFAAQEKKQGVELRVEERDAVLRGVVIGPEGSAAADIWVSATPAGAGIRASLSGGPEGEEEEEEVSVMVMVKDDGEGAAALGAASLPPVLTDDAGRFEIRGLKRGRYNLVAHGLKGSARGFLDGAETDRDLKVKLHELARIEGVVKLAGKPVELFRVELQNTGRPPKQVRSSEGRFTLFGIDPGEYTVGVKSSEGEAQAKVVVQAGEKSSVELQLEGLVRVRGRVVDQDGKAVAGAFVLPTPPQPDGKMSINISDDSEMSSADGTFDIGVAAGSYTLMVVAPGTGSMARQSLEVPASGAPLELGDIEIAVMHRPDAPKPK